MGSDPTTDDTSGGLTPDEFRDVFRRHAGGVTVVALSIDGRHHGFTATSVVSLAADPPLLLFSVAAGSSMLEPLDAAETLTVSFLAEDQADVARRFAAPDDRFADGGWTVLETGEPVIDGAMAWVRGRVERLIPVGDGRVVVIHALDHHLFPDRLPLVYRDRRYHRLAADSD